MGVQEWWGEGSGRWRQIGGGDKFGVQERRLHWKDDPERIPEGVQTASSGEGHPR